MRVHRYARPAERMAWALAALLSLSARAVPLTPEELATTCREADGPAHCGRLVEELQLKRLPNLAVRDGAALRVTLYPSGSVTFTDVDAPNGELTWNLWDFLSEINAVVLYTTNGDDAGFTVLQRTTGRKTDLPADPKLAPDRARLVTADFCAKRCVNELAVWRITKDSVRKELSWTPGDAWTDATASWKDSGTVTVEYTRAGATAPAKLERKLADPGWQKNDGP